MSATSLAVLMAWAQWTLWDFGTKQICHNSITGDHRVVYGNGAVFSDGPFTELIPHPDDQDKAVLLGPGDDETRPFHTLDECGAHTPTPQQRGGFPDWKTARLDSAAGEEGTAWVSELQSKCETVALELTGPAPLRLLFTRYEAPTTVGDKPVSLWVGFGRLADYVLRPFASAEGRDRKDFEHFRNARSCCTNLGLHEDHFRESVRASRKRDAPETEEDGGPKAVPAELAAEALSGDHDWQVSVRGVMFWLWTSISRGWVTKVPDKELQRAQVERAKTLLHRILVWPLYHGDQPESIAVHSMTAGCVTVLHEGVVDKGEMSSSEAEGRSGHRVRLLRTSGGRAS